MFSSYYNLVFDFQSIVEEVPNLIGFSTFLMDCPIFFSLI